MTRTPDGRRLYSLNDALTIASLVVAGGSVAGAVGGYYVLRFRMDATEKGHADLVVQVRENEQRDHERDVLIARTAERLESVGKTMAEIKAPHASGSAVQ